MLFGKRLKQGLQRTRKKKLEKDVNMKQKIKFGTPQEWIDWYEKKTGDTFTVPEGHTINYHERRGIITFKPDLKSGMLIVMYVIGDGKFWHDVAEMIAKQNGFRCVATICTRNVDAYIRFWDYKVVKEWKNKEGQRRFLTIDPFGRYATLTYRGIDERTGKDTYWVIQYLVPGERPNLDDLEKEGET